MTKHCSCIEEWHTDAQRALQSESVLVWGRALEMSLASGRGFGSFGLSVPPSTNVISWLPCRRIGYLLVNSSHCGSEVGCD